MENHMVILDAIMDSVAFKGVIVLSIVSMCISVIRRILFIDNDIANKLEELDCEIREVEDCANCTLRYDLPDCFYE